MHRSAKIGSTGNNGVGSTRTYNVTDASLKYSNVKGLIPIRSKALQVGRVAKGLDTRKGSWTVCRWVKAYGKPFQRAFVGRQDERTPVQSAG